MSKRIIVVDDDKDIREIMSFVLKRYGFEVATVAHGVQLQQYLERVLPDLIILDIMMPGEDGYHLCYNLRTDPRTCHLPIMVITAHTEDIYARISVDMGVALHMTKPFHPLEFAECVRTLLSSG